MDFSLAAALDSKSKKPDGGCKLGDPKHGTPKAPGAPGAAHKPKGHGSSSDSSSSSSSSSDSDSEGKSHAAGCKEHKGSTAKVKKPKMKKDKDKKAKGQKAAH